MLSRQIGNGKHGREQRIYGIHDDVHVQLIGGTQKMSFHISGACANSRPVVCSVCQCLPGVCRFPLEGVKVWKARSIHAGLLESNSKQTTIKQILATVFSFEVSHQKSTISYDRDARLRWNVLWISGTFVPYTTHNLGHIERIFVENVLISYLREFVIN